MLKEGEDQLTCWYFNAGELGGKVRDGGCTELTVEVERLKLGLYVDFPGETAGIHEDEDEWTLSPGMKTG